jgi:indole-3-glycerol phosphate synthase
MLDQIIAHKRSWLDAIDRISEIRNLEGRIGHLPPTIGFKESLQTNSDIAIIAEIKRMSPSKGILKMHIELPHLVRLYEKAGARAISVLTEDKFFGGSPDDLMIAKGNTSLPVLRKDFIIDEYQAWESRAMGADAVLLIARILSAADLTRLHQLARSLDLDVVVEVHDRAELDRALPLSPDIVGINTRNLATFGTDLTIFESLAAEVPPGILIIAESGVHTRGDVLYLKERGADAVLVGESIMTSADPFRKICELRGSVL